MIAKLKLLYRQNQEMGLEGVPYIYEGHCIRIGVHIHDGCTHDFGFIGDWEIVSKHTETQVPIHTASIFRSMQKSRPFAKNFTIKIPILV